MRNIFIPRLNLDSTIDIFSITVSMADTKDLFVEKFFANGTYEHQGQALQPITRNEVIAVKGKTPHVEEVIEVRYIYPFCA